MPRFPPCPSPTPTVHRNPHPSSQGCHPAISSSVVPFSSCPQSLPASESFPMVLRYMKSCSMSLMIMKMQIKMTMRYHLIPFKMNIIKTTRNNKLWGRYIEKGSLLHCQQRCKLVQPLWKTVWRFPKKLKIELSYDPAIPILGIYLKKMKTVVQKNICILLCSLEHYSQYPRYGNNVSVHWWMNEWRSFIYTQIEYCTLYMYYQFSHSLVSDSRTPWTAACHASLPVHHQLPEPTQTHIHRISDAIQPSHPLSSPSPTFNLSQHQALFQWVSSSHQVAKVLEFQLQHQSFQWIFRTDFL